MGVLDQAFETAQSRLAPLEVRRSEAGFQVGDGKPERTFLVDYDPLDESRGWTVTCEPWHAHFPTADQALDALERILRGEVQLQALYRDERLALVWSQEVAEDHYVHDGASASYLSPFHRGDWALYPGESWRCLSRRWHLLPAAHPVPMPETLPALGSLWEDEAPWDHETVMDHWFPESDEILIRRYGSPPLPHEWALDGQGDFLWAIPRGFRSLPYDSEQDGPGTRTYECEREGVFVRVSTLYADDVDPAEPPSEEVTFAHEEDGEEHPGWERWSWQKEFRVDGQRMLAVVELLRDCDYGNELSDLVEVLDQSVRASRAISASDFPEEDPAPEPASGAGAPSHPWLNPRSLGIALAVAALGGLLIWHFRR